MPVDSKEKISAKDAAAKLGKNSGVAKSPDVDGGWAWVVLVAATSAFTISTALFYSFSLYYIVLMNEFGSSRAVTASIGSLNTGVHILAGPIATFSINHIGTRYTIMLGSLVTLAGYIGSSYAQNITTLFITYGIITALGCCLDYTSWIITISNYFDKKYPVMYSVSQIGVGFGMFIFSPIVTYLIDKFGWRGSYLLCGGFALHFAVFAALIFPPRKAVQPAAAAEELGDLLPEKELEEVKSKQVTVQSEPEVLSVLGSFKELRVWLLHLVVFFNSFGTSVAILFADFAVYKFLDDYVIFTLASTGIGSLLGRVLAGPLGKLCKINTVIFYTLVLFCCSITLVTFPFVHSGIHLVVQAVLFSFCHGFQCTLCALVPREIFGSQSLSNVFGINMFFSGVGLLVGPPVSGLLVDLTHSYTITFLVAGSAEFLSAIICLILFFVVRRHNSNLKKK